MCDSPGCLDLRRRCHGLACLLIPGVVAIAFMVTKTAATHQSKDSPGNKGKPPAVQTVKLFFSNITYWSSKVKREVANGTLDEFQGVGFVETHKLTKNTCEIKKTFQRAGFACNPIPGTVTRKGGVSGGGLSEQLG
jgi:hypothetical protein